MNPLDYASLGPRRLNIERNSGSSTTKPRSGVYQGAAVIVAILRWRPYMLDFEVFKDRGSKKINEEPRVTLQKKGVIALNQSAFELLGSPQAVELLYAPKARTMGIRAADPALSHAYSPRLPKGGYTRLVAAIAFFKRYGIAVEAIERYPAKMLGDVLAIDLSQREAEQG